MKLEDKHVVVTGGAGFIGSHLVDALVEKENKVTIIDDLSSGAKENVQTHLDSGAAILVETNIFDERQVLEAMPKADVVFHLACRNVRHSLRQPTVVHDINSTGTLNILKAATKVGVKRFLYCSSSEVNGTADIVPMPEEYHFKPETIYGASKLTGEYYTQVFQRSKWLNTVIVRPHNNYGPREHYEGSLGEVIPRFILYALAGKPLTIYGDGLQTRDFTYVEETAKYMIKILENDATISNTYNLCRGNEVSVFLLATLICELVGSKSEIVHLPGRPNDVLRLYGDPTRLRDVCGSSPSVDIKEGLEKTLQWFQENVPLTDEVFATMDVRSWEHLEAEPWMTTSESS